MATDSSEVKIWRPYKSGCPVTLVNVAGSDDPLACYDFILDTGSPHTYIAGEIRDERQLAPDGTEASGQFLSGEATFRVCLADLAVFGKTLPRVRVLVSDVSLLGRDVLRRFVLTFDGPRERWTVEDGLSAKQRRKRAREAAAMRWVPRKKRRR